MARRDNIEGCRAKNLGRVLKRVGSEGSYLADTCHEKILEEG